MNDYVEALFGAQKVFNFVNPLFICHHAKLLVMLDSKGEDGCD